MQIYNGVIRMDHLILSSMITLRNLETNHSNVNAHIQRQWFENSFHEEHCMILKIQED